MIEKSYSQIMGESSCNIVLTVDTAEPVELADFVGQLVSIGNQFDSFIKQEHPDLRGDAKFYIQEIRSGSTVIEILPVLMPLIERMDQILIVHEFLRRYSKRITSYFHQGGRDENANKSDLKDIMGAVKAIARDPRARAQLDYVTHEDGKAETRTIFKFHTAEARSAINEIEHHKSELDHKSGADHERVLMTFTRSDFEDAPVGKPSGERVKIAEISPKSLALMYGSELAGERIKHEIREHDQNIYYKGFVVDVNVQMRNGSPIAYSVTNVHQVLDLPDDD